MNSQVLVTILIDNYNYGRFVGAAIESALSQTYDRIEIIVVDDGSLDNSREVIASYLPQVVPVFKENGGQASAFNAGFAASSGDIICFLDADDIFLPEKVAEVVKALPNVQESSWCFHPLKLADVDSQAIDNISYPGSVVPCDLRLDMQRGGLRGSKLPFPIPGTSGLCFTRPLLAQILPMPEAEAIALNDSYLQFAAIFLSKGVALAKELALQRVHEDNAYTLKTDKQRLVARINILTAYWLRTNFPALSKFTDKLFAAGLATYWRTGGIETSSQAVIKKYWLAVPPLERLNIGTRILYYSLKT
jgi:glycosyltransferase involved in cell wall biosynthesis